MMIIISLSSTYLGRYNMRKCNVQLFLAAFMIK